MEADPVVLSRTAEGLRRSGQALDAAGASKSSALDGGEDTALMQAVLAHLVESAGNVVVGLQETADRVDMAGSTYLAQDTNAATTLRELF